MTNPIRCARAVDTSTYNATVETIDLIISECMYEGIQCDRPSALVAAYSVPDGAPIWFAADNLVVGGKPNDAICSRHESLKRATGYAMRQYAH